MPVGTSEFVPKFCRQLPEADWPAHPLRHDMIVSKYYDSKGHPVPLSKTDWLIEKLRINGTAQHLHLADKDDFADYRIRLTSGTAPEADKAMERARKDYRRMKAGHYYQIDANHHPHELGTEQLESLLVTKPKPQGK